MKTLIAACLLVLALPAAAYGQADPEDNQPDYWCDAGQGVKLEPVATPFVVPEPEEGTAWTLLVLKAGTTNETVSDPIPGQGYTHSTGKDLSHVILCWENDTTTTTTTSSTTTSTSTTTTTTTTTDPTTTTSSSTTTTQPPTTTTSSPTTTEATTTTTTTTAPPTTTTTTPTLPMTGAPLGVLAAAGFGALTLGAAALAAGRRDNE